MSSRLPLLILAGSDSRRVNVPSGLHSSDMLEGYKGALILPNGRPLVAEVIDRMRESGRFLDPVVVGPARVYASLGLDCEVVDSDGALSRTLQDAVRTISSQFGTHASVAFSACDILPTAEEISTLMADVYDPVRGSAFWSQLVEASPQEMGASRWKPGYRLLVPSRGPVNLYPGHLIVVRPAALRFAVVVQLLQLAYRYRSRPLWQRALGLTIPGVGALALQDLRNLSRLQMPVLSASIPYHFISGYLRYLRHSFSVPDLETTFARTFVHRDAQTDASRRPVVFSVTRMLSLAKDIDTKAELDEATL